MGQCTNMNHDYTQNKRHKTKIGCEINGNKKDPFFFCQTQILRARNFSVLFFFFNKKVMTQRCPHVWKSLTLPALRSSVCFLQSVCCVRFLPVIWSVQQSTSSLQCLRYSQRATARERGNEAARQSQGVQVDADAASSPGCSIKRIKSPLLTPEPVVA